MSYKAKTGSSVTTIVYSVAISFGMILGVSGYVQAQQTSSSSGQYTVDQYRETLDRYCVTCHNETLNTAFLMLDKANVNNIGEAPHIWEKLITKLSLRSMPPVGMPRPDEAFYKSFIPYLETNLDKHAESNPNPGTTVSAHRLNRTEYANAVRDLLAVDIDEKSMLLADNSGGFDNLGNLLSVSQVLLENYMAVASQVSSLAVGNPNAKVDSHIYSINPLLMQHERMGQDMPFGSRGGMTAQHYFPADGEYVIKVRLQRDEDGGYILGLSQLNHLDIRVDGERAQLFPVGGENRGVARGSKIADTPSYEQANYELTADDKLNVRVPVKAGMRAIQVTFLKQDYAWEEASIRPRTYRNFNEARVTSIYDRAFHEPMVSSVTIDGPYNVSGVGNTVSREKIFVCAPASKSEEEPCAGKILSQLARLGYRRPVNDKDISPLLDLYKVGRQEGGTFDSGIRKAIEGLLISSKFLFRVENVPLNSKPGTNYALDDIKLASRLSFFLWSSIPDDELLMVAEQGKLSDQAILEKQVSRMLKDKRSQALVDNFAEQWLLLRNLPAAQKSTREFPGFDEELRNAFYEEVRLFVGSIFADDRSILDLFRADYSFLNERLARHYGVDGIYGNRFRRVTLEKHQQGLLARAGILSITSYPNRNSTVLRGKWVLENILASPPPPPPNDIPPLEDAKGAPGEVLTLRQKMEIHPANPVCAVCHNQMDPIGFGLENYDAIGQWRTEDSGHPINASGRLPSGVEFEGPAELQAALLSEPRVIANAFTQKLLMYALGRSVDYYDMPAVRKITDSAAAEDYSFSKIVSGIVTSVPFQMRRTEL